MALYWEDWSGETIGAISVPAGWTRRWDTGNADLSIVADASAPSGKALHIVKPVAGDRFLLSFDALDSDADRANCEILALVRIPTTGIMDGSNFFGCVARASGNDTAETGYISNLAFVGTSPVIMNRRIVIYQNGTTVGTPLTVAVDTFANTQGGLYWVKFRCEGTSITVAIMPYGGAWSEESTVDSTVTAAGWVGLFCFSLNSSVDVLAVSVATDGDYATLPDPEPHVFKTELIAANGYVNLGQPEVLNSLVARTYMAYMRPTGVQNPGYLFVKAGNDGVGGPRVQISNTNMNVALVTPTSASNLAPIRTTVNTSLAYDAWTHHAVTWDGVSPCNTQAQWFIDGAAVNENQTAGSSPYLDGAGYDFRMFNRGGLDRACLGSFAYMVIWNRELSEAEIAQAYADGPLSVPDGLVLCWANGRDYGPNALTPTARSTFAAGVLPPNIALGSSAPAETFGDLAVAETGDDVFAGTSPMPDILGDMAVAEVGDDTFFGQQTSTIELTLTTDGDSFNASPVTSWIETPGHVQPVVHVYVRVVYSNWRQFVFKVGMASGKRPVFTIHNPEDYVSSFNSTWRPWYSYDGVNWQRFDTAPVNATTQWYFGHSVAFTQDDVWISYQPAWPVWRAPWLISELQGIDASLIRELPSAPDFEYPTTLTAQTDELSRAVPGQKMYAFGIWADGELSPSSAFKRNVVITGGVHAGEHVGNWAMEGFVRFLVSGDAKALALLEDYKFFIYPLLNPMGRWMGHYRGQRVPGYSSLDTNRDYPVDNSPSIAQSSTVFREMLATDLGTQRVAFSLDFHGTWGSSTSFYYYSALSVDPNAIYIDEWHARIQAYSTGYVRMDSLLDTTVDQYVSRNYGPYHSYVPELYESSAFAAGTDALELIGADYARALSDCPRSEMLAPYNILMDGTKIDQTIRWFWIRPEDVVISDGQTITSDGEIVVFLG